MIRQLFDFTVAEYPSIEEINFAEAFTADMVQIRGQVKGGVYHAQRMFWKGNIAGFSSAEEFIRSKKERKSIHHTLDFFEKDGYEFRVTPITEELYDEFVTLYQETTLQRERAILFNLKEQILSKIKVEIPTYLVGMYKNEVLESGLVFSVNKNKGEALVSFGAKKKFTKVRGGVGGSLEYHLLKFCFEHGIQEIGHGKTINPAGISGKAGIFEFKSRYGFTAFPEGPWLTTFILNQKIAISDLIFITLEKGSLAYKVISQNPEEELLKKYKTREIKTVHLQSFAQTIKSHRSVLKKLQSTTES